jgi:uncharacterized membrane protein
VVNYSLRKYFSILSFLKEDMKRWKIVITESNLLVFFVILIIFFQWYLLKDSYIKITNFFYGILVLMILLNFFKKNQHTTEDKFPLISIVLTYIFFSFYLQIIEFYNFNNWSNNVLNNIYNVAHGSFIATENDLDKPSSVFHWHMFLIWILLVPLYAIYSHPLLLHFIQTVIVGLGAFAVYGFTHRMTKDNFLAMFFSIFYLFNPCIIYANLLGLYHSVLNIGFTAFLLYGIFFHKRKMVIIFFILSLLSGAPATIITAPLGLYLIFNLKRRKEGLVILIVSLIWFYINREVHIMVNNGLDQYAGVKDKFIFYILNPGNFILSLLTFRKLMGLTAFIVSTGLIGVANALFPVALPTLLSIHLKNYNFFPGHWYMGPVSVIMIFSTILSLRKKVFRKLIPQEKKLKFIIALVILIFFFQLSIFITSYRNPMKFKISSHYKNIRPLLESVPSHASVSSMWRFRPFFANRKVMFCFFPTGRVIQGRWLKKFNLSPYKFWETRDCEYVVLDFYPYGRDYRHPQLDILSDHPVVKKVFSVYGVEKYKEGVVILRKGIKKTIKDFIKLKEEEISKLSPQYVIDKNFNNQLKLKGYDYYLDKEDIYITLYWEVLAQISKDFKVKIILTDSNGAKKEIIHKPIYGLAYLDNWKKGEIFRDEVKIPLRAVWSNKGIKISFLDL